MQKRIAFLVCTVLALSIVSAAQMGGDKPRPSPAATAQCKLADGKSIKVAYSSPRAKGRKILRRSGALRTGVAHGRERGDYVCDGCESDHRRQGCSRRQLYHVHGARRGQVVADHQAEDG